MVRLAAGSLAVARSRVFELSIVKHVWRVVLVMLLAVFCVDGWSALPEGCSGDLITCSSALGYGTCRDACHCSDPWHCEMNQSAIVGKSMTKQHHWGYSNIVLLLMLMKDARMFLLLVLTLSVAVLDVHESVFSAN